MQKNDPVYFDIWREDLSLILEKFQAWRFNTRFYFLKVFIFFVVINDLAYWFAIATAFPKIITGDDLAHYSKVQIPVAILGALFDSLSLYITILVVGNALRSRSNLSYISHLSIDALIAIAATFWVLFVFSISAWIVGFMPDDPKPVVKKEIQIEPLVKKEIQVEPQTLSSRGKLYEGRVVAAINNPTGDNEMKNIYFGIVMGFSAIIPTVVHISCALFSLRLFLQGEKT
ncbi:MAG: hypothetical protein ACI9UO_003067 [Nitrospinales bacterium]|jgi:hypothetical protein